MKSSLRNTIVAGTVAAGLLGSGGIAFAQSSTTTPTEQGSATDAAGRSADREARRAEQTADLANRLGVTDEQVTAARDTARAAVEAQFGARPERPTERPTTPPTDEERAARAADREARHDLFDQTFAAELGVSTEQVHAAREAGLQERLAEKVADGTLTQEEADARLQAMQNGERPMRGEGGPGGPGRHGPPSDADGDAPTS